MLWFAIRLIKSKYSESSRVKIKVCFNLNSSCPVDSLKLEDTEPKYPTISFHSKSFCSTEIEFASTLECSSREKILDSDKQTITFALPHHQLYLLKCSGFSYFSSFSFKLFVLFSTQFVFFEKTYK